MLRLRKETIQNKEEVTFKLVSLPSIQILLLSVQRLRA